MSVCNFARVFLKQVGETPSQFVERVRTSGARRLLDTSDKSIDEIAALVGFASSVALRRAFKQHAGQTPAAYRARVR